MIAASPVITSAAQPLAQVVHGRVITDAPAALPDRIVGSGIYRVQSAKCGLPELVGPAGESCGLFANEQLAQSTAALFSR